jgi:hypothetical protein
MSALHELRRERDVFNLLLKCSKRQHGATLYYRKLSIAARHLSRAHASVGDAAVEPALAVASLNQTQSLLRAAFVEVECLLAQSYFMPFALAALASTARLATLSAHVALSAARRSGMEGASVQPASWLVGSSAAAASRPGAIGDRAAGREEDVPAVDLGLAAPAAHLVSSVGAEDLGEAFSGLDGDQAAAPIGDGTATLRSAGASSAGARLVASSSEAAIGHVSAHKDLGEACEEWPSGQLGAWCIHPAAAAHPASLEVTPGFVVGGAAKLVRGQLRADEIQLAETTGGAAADRSPATRQSPPVAGGKRHSEHEAVDERDPRRRASGSAVPPAAAERGLAPVLHAAEERPAPAMRPRSRRRSLLCLVSRNRSRGLAHAWRLSMSASRPRALAMAATAQRQ